VEKAFSQLIPDRWGLLKIWAGTALLLCAQTAPLWSQALSGAVSQQAVIDAQAQQERERQKKLALEAKPGEKPPVEATEVSEDLGSLQLVRPKPDLPFARLHMDQSYSWLSNANYAKNSQNVVAAWQSISSIEGAWAPTFSTMPGYENFTPEVGLRTSFFNYFSQEEPANTNTQSQNSKGAYDIGLAQDFILVNMFFRANQKVSDELSVGLSVDVNGYFYLNTPSERYSVTGEEEEKAKTNFLNEITCAYSSNYFHAFSETQAVTLSWRASYVFSNPTFYSRTDNSLTGSYLLSLTEKISLSPFASYRLAYYTDATSATPTQDYNDQGELTDRANGFSQRLDQQFTLGVGLNFALTPQLSTGLNFNYSKSDSTSQIAETGDFTNLTAGANWSMTYKFSEKEFVVPDPSDCLGPYTRVDLGFGFVNNLESSQTLTGSVLPGIRGTLANPSISVNPGVRFDVSPGFNFTDWLGVELSGGILYNGLDHLNGNGTLTLDGGTEPIGDGGLSLTGRYIQVPALVSTVFRWPGQGRWKPYLSTGFGFAYSQLQITQVEDTQTSDQFEEAYSPAFSVGSGFIWQVSDAVDFDVAYKLLGVINPAYSGLQPGVVLSNSVQFGINVRF
jgi:opacity protein-like surface antigen